MKKTHIIPFILIILISLLTGCWSRREINELSIASAVGIDKSKDGYLVTVQLINPGEIASKTATTRTAVTTYRTSGETIFEALRRLTLETPRKIYLGHIRLLVFGEEFARNGIGKALDIFSRDHEIRTDFYIMVAKNEKAEKLLNILTPVEKIPAGKMYSSLEMSSDSWAPTKTVQLDELINSLISEGKNPVLTGVFIKGDPKTGMDIRNVEKVDSPTTVQICNLAAFKKDKLVGWLNEPQSKGLNYIEGNVSSTVFNVPCSNKEKLAVELIRTKVKVNGKVENEEPKINIELLAEANISDVECKIDLSKPENIYKLEQKVAQRIKNVMEQAVKKAQNDFKSDIFGFGEAIHRADPKAWKKLKKDWGKEFEDLTVNIHVTAKIRRKGTITKSLQNDIKE
ncbi:Ger(x)C family spore germination protein [Tepidibacter hydrothermalis]|uniref:Ger(X)C family spore germination protein n=1 Tax=Tepidibacter hydrothermalis TaxID=3036126 RepID=A0ABY8EFX2_9FIRM|nr:Ger(x)C family spore germination protein [Tepidibacter hydrothermalis]WFD09643.1 Ger(x)C family spore germination protein [Tepidibacter hydrothermalis]